MHDKISFRLDGRELKTDGRLYSGEAVTIDIHGIGGTLAASDYKLVIYGRDKAVLAVSDPFAADTASGDWTAQINTATDAMSNYFAAVKADAVKTLGIVVVNTDTADTIAHGILDVISVPFADELTPVPQILSYVTYAELDTILADYATHAELQTVADAAETAQDTATSALTEATSAWDTAVAAESAAETAQQTAETAMTQALSAQGLANVAQDLAGQAMGSAIAASTAAGAAQQTADGAADTALSAQSEAFRAVTYAQLVDGKADEVRLTADTAKLTADEAIAGLATKANAQHEHDAADITDGTLNAARLPIASASALGGIKVGEGLTVTADGTLSATGGGGGFTFAVNKKEIIKHITVNLTLANGTVLNDVQSQKFYSDVVSVEISFGSGCECDYIVWGYCTSGAQRSYFEQVGLIDGFFVSCGADTTLSGQRTISGKLAHGGLITVQDID